MRLSIQQTPIDNIHPHPRNVRQGDVGAIAESLRAHGQYRPIVVQKSSGDILAGNHTWKAAKALGWTQVDVTFVDVDDDEAARILLIDNRANDLATYDDEGLAELLQELAASELSLEGTGFDGDDLDDLLFKLNGGLGNLGEGNSAAERLEEFESRGVKSFILPFQEYEYDEMVGLLKKMREHTGHDNNSDSLKHLLLEMGW